MLFQSSVIIRVRYDLYTLCIVDDSLAYYIRKGLKIFAKLHVIHMHFSARTSMNQLSHDQLATVHIVCILLMPFT